MAGKAKAGWDSGRKGKIQFRCDNTFLLLPLHKHLLQLPRWMYPLQPHKTVNLGPGNCPRNDSEEEDSLVQSRSSSIQELHREEEEQQDHGPGLAERGLLGRLGYMKTIRVTNSCLRTH